MDGWVGGHTQLFPGTFSPPKCLSVASGSPCSTDVRGQQQILGLEQQEDPLREVAGQLGEEVAVPPDNEEGCTHKHFGVIKVP